MPSVMESCQFYNHNFGSTKDAPEGPCNILLQRGDNEATDATEGLA